jgi:hypothetical protein
MDPLSPTYRPTFGDYPKEIDDAVATTDAQCAQAAEAEFKKSGGISEEFTINLMKNALLEVGDTIERLRPDEGRSALYVVEQFDFPMGTEPISGLIKRKL